MIDCKEHQSTRHHEKYFIEIFDWLSIKRPGKRTISKNVIWDLAKKTISKDVIKNMLIQIRPFWDPHGDNNDSNKWSRIHLRYTKHNGCIVDLGCAGWNLAFEDKNSDNCAKYYFGKKEYIMTDLGLYG